MYWLSLPFLVFLAFPMGPDHWFRAGAGAHLEAVQDAAPAWQTSGFTTSDGGSGVPPHKSDGGSGVPPHKSDGTVGISSEGQFTTSDGGSGVPPHRL